MGLKRFFHYLRLIVLLGELFRANLNLMSSNVCPMLMKDKGKLVIWPVYIDKTRSRSKGRIISRKSSVDGPTLLEIGSAARKLGMNPEVEADKAYPKSWWESKGRVLIDNSAPKTALARKIAATIKEMRSGQAK
jgi:signal recognition particle subunit SRP19